jgi:hypothetical protein
MNLLRAIASAALLAGGLQACCVRSCDGGGNLDARSATGPVVAGKLDIVGWGPRRTVAGVPFNRQPAGHATLWIRVAQRLDGRMGLVQFGDAVLEGRVSGGLLTARVPETLYATPGRYEVRAIARTDDALWKSDAVSFTVRPARARAAAAP